MAAISIGDIVVLSQTAWSVARAFRNGRNNAPREFIEVQAEADGLSEALRLLAETLHDDGSLLTSADKTLQHAVATILRSAETTLEDLESLIDRYQVLKKTQTHGGFVVEKSWSDLVYSNYKKMRWTTEKGDIDALRNMLQMHAHSITLTMQALQSKSLARIERTVLPMADKVDVIHSTVNGSLTEKLDDVHRIMMAIANGTPSYRPLEAPDTNSQSAAELDLFLPPPRPRRLLPDAGLPSPPLSPVLQQRAATPRTIIPPIRYSADPWLSNDDEQSPKADATVVRDAYETDALDEYLEELEIENRAKFDSVHSMTDKPQGLSRRLSDKGRRDSQTLPSILLDTSMASAAADMSYHAEEDSRYDSPVSPRSRPTARQVSSQFAESRHSVSSTTPQHKHTAYLKQLFRNSARLFDDHATLTEFTRFNPEEADMRYATELVPISTECRTYVVRKRENLPHGGHTYATSIWIIADDFSVRVQQKLPDFRETIPLSSVFTPEKVSLSGNVILHHHSETWGEPAISETTTAWINYVFDTGEAAGRFQSAIFGRNLLETFRTEKTIVVHQGLRGAFAFEEQMCGIENLRLWEDDGLSVPNAGGGVLALIHLSPSFGEGWIRFWINNSRHRIRVRGDSGRTVKIKDLNAAVSQLGTPRRDPGASHRKNTDRRVSGMRIEFSTEDEKKRFLAMVERIQEKMIALPDMC